MQSKRDEAHLLLFRVSVCSARTIQRSTCSKSSLKGMSKIEGLASLKGKLAI